MSHHRLDACLVQSMHSAVLPAQRPHLGGPAGTQRDAKLGQPGSQNEDEPKQRFQLTVKVQPEQMTKILSSATSIQAPMNCLLKQALIFELPCSSLHCPVLTRILPGQFS